VGSGASPTFSLAPGDSGVSEPVSSAAGGAASELGALAPEPMRATGLPIATVVPAGARISCSVPASKAPDPPRVDLPGLLLSTAAMALLVFTIIEAPGYGWGSAGSVAGFAGSAVLLAGFIAWERRTARPMLDVRLFRNMRFSAASGAVTVSFFTLFGFIFLITQYFQFVRGYGPLSTGVRLLPVALSVGAGSVAGTQIALRAGTKLIVTAGLVAMAGFYGWVAATTSATPRAVVTTSSTAVALPSPRSTKTPRNALGTDPSASQPTLSHGESRSRVKSRIPTACSSSAAVCAASSGSASMLSRLRPRICAISPAWGVMPVTEFRPSPLGMIYVTTRRVGELAWVRVNDHILPNLAQAGAIWEAGTKEKAFTRMSLTRWTVPIDDTNSLVIGVRHFNEGVNDPAGRHSEAACGKETVDFLGQTGERAYNERQRVPGDFDAQVSQRPIAIHALEHLGTTDRGVSMLRGMVRKGIRAVRAGAEPDCVRGALGKVISTYCSDSVVRVSRRTGRNDETVYGTLGVQWRAS